MLRMYLQKPSCAHPPRPHTHTRSSIKCWCDSLAKLVVGSFDKLEFCQRHPNGTQHGFDDSLVVRDPLLKQLPWGLHVVQVGMQVCKQDRHLQQANSGQTIYTNTEHRQRWPLLVTPEFIKNQWRHSAPDYININDSKPERNPDLPPTPSINPHPPNLHYISHLSTPLHHSTCSSISPSKDIPWHVHPLAHLKIYHAHPWAHLKIYHAHPLAHLKIYHVHPLAQLKMHKIRLFMKGV